MLEPVEIYDLHFDTLENGNVSIMLFGQNTVLAGVWSTHDVYGEILDRIKSRQSTNIMLQKAENVKEREDRKFSCVLTNLSGAEIDDTYFLADDFDEGFDEDLVYILRFLRVPKDRVFVVVEHQRRAVAGTCGDEDAFREVFSEMQEKGKIRLAVPKTQQLADGRNSTTATFADMRKLQFLGFDTSATVH